MTIKQKVSVGILTAIIMTLSNASVQGNGVEEIVSLSREISAIIPANAHVQKLADGFGFLEGPVWVHSRAPGHLLFSDIPANVIDKWTPGGGVAVFVVKSGFTGTNPEGVGYRIDNGRKMVALLGSNAITLDKEGRIVFCQHGNRDIVRLENDGQRTVLASRYHGKRLNSPNDLVYKSDGSLYFTDPPYGLAGLDHDPKKELPFNGVYRLAKGKLQLLYKRFDAPNGIAFSPGERYLYVDDTASKTYWRFDVLPDGAIAHGSLFCDMSQSKQTGGPDGMKVDQAGNVYGVGPGGIWILSPQGKHLGTIRLPQQPANLAWGDSDGKTLYITARTGLYRIHLKIPGIRP